MIVEAAPSAEKRRRGSLPIAVAAVTVGLFAGESVLAARHHQSSGWLGAGFVVVTLVVGVIVARHLPRNPIGWLLLAIPGGVGAFTLCQQLVLSLHRVHPVLAVAAGTLTEVFYYLFLFSAPLVILFFPDGALPSPRWRRVLWTYIALATVEFLVIIGWGLSVAVRHSWHFDATGNLSEQPGTTVTVMMEVAVIGCLVLALSWVARRIVGYRRSSGVVRQQYKWLALGAICLLISLITSQVTSSAPSTTTTVEISITDLAALPFPLTVGIAILRYRLYDIERVISRTLSYALLTGLLIGVYVAIVTVSTRVLPFSSPVAVAASTLVAAALFNPLRRHIQRIVDRRFNRSRYDTERTINAFRSQVRDAIDLTSIRGHLLDAVNEALEPTQVTVWVAPQDSR